MLGLPDAVNLRAQVARGLPAIVRVLRKTTADDVSSATGSLGWTSVSGGGCDAMIVAISIASLGAWNAFRPVSIS